MTPILIHTTERGRHKYRVFFGFLMDPKPGSSSRVMIVDGNDIRFTTVDYLPQKCTPHFYTLLSEADQMESAIRQSEAKMRLWPDRVDDIDRLKKELQWGRAA